MDTIDFQAFKRRRETHSVQNEERVWNRAERLSQIFMDTHFESAPQQTRAFTDAVDAVIQYIENERPVEKANQIRDDQLIEMAAGLQAKGLMASARNQAVMPAAARLSEVFMETFMQEQPANFIKFRNSVDTMLNSCVMPVR